MTALRLAEDPAVLPRESAKVARVARMLDVDQSQVRRLVENGEIQSYRIGKRGIRIYLDSVKDWQERRAQPARTAQAAEQSAPRRRLSGIGLAAHRSSVASLVRKGLMRG